MLSRLYIKYRRDEQGFSLLEVLIAMAISSIVCIAVVATIPSLFKQTYLAYFQYQLDREVRQTIISMEKDFRRIGYCSRISCQGEAIQINEKFLSRYPNSCIIFAYDQDLSGNWINSVNAKKNNSDYFGYRLNGNKLEVNRNVINCDGTRWQSLFDANLIKVSQLKFDWHPLNALLVMTLKLETRLLPNNVFNYHTTILLRNLQ